MGSSGRSGGSFRSSSSGSYRSSGYNSYDSRRRGSSYGSGSSSYGSGSSSYGSGSSSYGSGSSSYGSGSSSYGSGSSSYGSGSSSYGSSKRNTTKNTTSNTTSNPNNKINEDITKPSTDKTTNLLTSGTSQVSQNGFSPWMAFYMGHMIGHNNHSSHTTMYKSKEKDTIDNNCGTEITELKKCISIYSNDTEMCNSYMRGLNDCITKYSKE
jgi:hypothetical protein